MSPDEPYDDGVLWAELYSGHRSIGFSDSDARLMADRECRGEPVWGPDPVFSGELCEHGLSVELCDGPQHYPYDEDERGSW